MSGRKVVSGKNCIKVLCNQFGFVFVRQKGSHVVLRNESHVTVVPIHKELKKGTLKGILRLAGVSEDAFHEAL